MLAKEIFTEVYFQMTCGLPAKHITQVQLKYNLYVYLFRLRKKLD